MKTSSPGRHTRRSCKTSLVQATSYALDALESRLFLDSTIGVVSMPVTGLLSAAVYDSNGALVQSLLQTRASTMGEQVSLVWDGKNAAGDVVPNNQTYQWRAIISTVKGVDEGAVGDSGNPSYGISESNGGVGGLAVDSSGDLYSSSWWEEPHKDLRKYRQSDGWTLWSNNFTGGYGGIATDGTSVYVARAWSQGGNEDRVYRFDAATGANLNYSGSGNSFLAINASRTQTPARSWRRYR